MIVERTGGELTVTSFSPEQTAAMGAAIGGRLHPNDVVLLFGDLGAGKTTLVQGIAGALGAREPVTSPTFTLIHEYHGHESLLVHVDPYRLAGAEEVEGLGFLDYLGQGNIIAVEWAERLGDLAPADALAVKIEQTGEDERRITLVWDNPKMMELAVEIEALP